MSRVRSIQAAVLAAVLVVAAACTTTSGREPEIIDPQGSEFQQRRDETRDLMSGAEKMIRAGASTGRVVGVREQVGCVRSDQGPKGSEPWDSQCDLRRSLGIFGGDPVAVMLQIDRALAAQRYRGTWYGREPRVEVPVADVRSGKVPAGKVESAMYTNGSGLAITLQPGRSGERQLFVSTTPRSSYFEQSGGEDWESVVPRGSTIKEPLVAVELRVPHFISRPLGQ